METEFLSGMMEMFMKENLQIIASMEKEFILGVIKDNIVECGKIIK